jgi:hypothetical protein
MAARSSMSASASAVESSSGRASPAEASQKEHRKLHRLVANHCTKETGLSAPNRCRSMQTARFSGAS